MRTWVEVIEPVEDVGLELAHARGIAWWALALAAVVLCCTHENNLEGDDNNQGQWVGDDSPWDCEVVQSAAVKHLCASLEPGSTLEGCAIGLQQHVTQVKGVKNPYKGQLM